MRTFDEKIDDATHAALNALGLSAELNPDTADLINDALKQIAQHVVTGDTEDD